MDTPYKISKIGDGFWAIDERGVFMYLIEGTDEAMLVDTGFGGGDLKALAESLTKKPLFAVITHADPDHIGACGQFSEVFMHPSDFDRYYEKSENKIKLRPVWEGGVFDLGGRKFEVVHIPGHTPGSIALFDKANRLVISGDSFQYGGIFMFGGGRNFRAFEASVNRMLKIKDGISEIYPGHDRYPVGSAIFEDLLDGLRILETGSVEGKDTGRPIPAKLYECGKVKFIVGSQTT